MKNEVVTSVIALINAEFGKEAPITVQRSKIQEYLGMTLDFAKQGKVMDDDMDEVKTTPAASYLFDINPNAEPLNDGKAPVFHSDEALSPARRTSVFLY